jgi:uncharacterized membrane protein
VSWIRYRNVWAGAFDLGVFDQGVWLLSKGKDPHVTITGMSLWQDHFSLVLVAFAGLYRLAATPLWLLGAQALAVGTTIVPARAFAREVGAPTWMATAGVLLGFPVIAAVIFDFHPVTLALPAVMWAALAAQRNDPVAAAMAGAIALLCRADLGIAMLALAIIASGRKTRLVLIATGLVGVIAGAAVPELAGGGDAWVLHYGALGTGPIDAATHPWRAARELVQPGNIGVLAFWFMPTAGLALLRPRWAVAAVVAALPILLSGDPATTVPWFHYGAVAFPLVLAGALAGYPVLDEERRHLATRVVPATLLATMLLFGPFWPRTPAHLRLPTVLFANPDAAEFRAAKRLVDSGEGVSAEDTVLTYLAHRDVAFIWPVPFEKTRFEELPDPDPALAARVDWIITPDGSDLDAKATAFGFERVACAPCGDIAVFRRA